MLTHYRIILIFCLFSLPILAEETPVLVIDPHGHSSTITDIMFTPDGRVLISVSFDKTIRLWDVETGDLIKTIRGYIGDGYEGALMAGALSSNGKILAVGGFLGPQGREPELTGHIRLFHLDSGEQIGLLAGHENVVFGLDFSADGQWLASAGGDRLTAIWDISSILAQPGAEPGLIAVFGNSSSPGPPVYDVAFSPKNKRVFVAADYRRTMTLRELRSNPSDRTGQDALQSSYEMEGHRDQVRCVEFSPDSEYIVSGGKDGMLVLWDGDGKYLKQLDRFKYPVGTISFSADSAKIVVSGLLGRETHVYAIPSGERLLTFPHHTNTVEASAFSGSNLIATAGGNQNDIYIWDASSGNIRTHITNKGREILALAFDEYGNLAFGNSDLSPPDFEGVVPQQTPDYVPLEKTFALTDMRYARTLSATDDFTRVRTTSPDFSLEWTAKDILRIVDGGTIANAPNTDGLIRSYTFTPDGNVVVGSSYSLKLYRPDGGIIRQFTGHTSEIWAVSVSHDGRILASGSNDQTIKFWNLATGECLATLFVTTDHEWVCWTPQGYYAASAGGEKYIGWQMNQGRNAAAQDVPIMTRQVDNTEALRTLASDEFGVVILAASTGDESSLEHADWEHGAFTKALLEALEEGLADYSKDGIVHLRELDLYLADRVETLTNGAQHPTTQKPSTISRFPVVQMK